MDTHVILWILGVIQAIFVISIPAAIKAYVELNNRLTRVETAFELFGKNVLKAMHRDDNFHQADHLIDEYIRREGELTPAQWTDLMDIFRKVLDEGDAKHGRGELVGAAAVVAFCEHKLKAFKPK